MKLIIAEKNDAARQIAERLSTGKPKKDKVYNTAIYRFEWKGEECVTIGLAGHILAPDFCDSVLFDKKAGLVFGHRGRRDTAGRHARWPGASALRHQA